MLKNTHTTVAVIVGLISIATAIFGVARYYIPRAEAEAMVQVAAVDREAGDIETQLGQIALELKLLRDTRERRPLSSDEEAREEYLKKRRELLERRQLELVK